MGSKCSKYIPIIDAGIYFSKILTLNIPAAIRILNCPLLQVTHTSVKCHSLLSARPLTGLLPVTHNNQLGHSLLSDRPLILFRVTLQYPTFHSLFFFLLIFLFSAFYNKCIYNWLNEIDYYTSLCFARVKLIMLFHMFLNPIIKI